MPKSRVYFRRNLGAVGTAAALLSANAALRETNALTKLYEALDELVALELALNAPQVPDRTRLMQVLHGVTLLLRAAIRLLDDGKPDDSAGLRTTC